MPFSAENRLHYFFKPIIMVFDMMEDSMTIRPDAPTADFEPLRGKRVLIALSGGADSVALAAMLAHAREEYGLTLFAAHVDHAIRPESAGDATFCEALCQRLDIPLRVVRVDVPAEAERSGEGLESAARRLRYKALRCMKAEVRADGIALAHHMDDQAETVLMHLARGAGPEGIGGMRAISGDLYRPLLGLRKAQLVEYLQGHGLSWREDATNFVPDTPRNALRLHGIPELEKCYPQFVRAAARYAQTAQIESDLVAGLTRDYLKRASAAGPFCAWLDVSDPPHPAVLRRALRALCQRDTLCPQGLNFDQVAALEALCAAAKGRLDLGNCLAERAGRRLYFVPKRLPEIAPAELAPDGVTRLPGIGSVRAAPCDPVPIRDDPFRQALSAEALADAVLRTRRPGDRVRPLGCGDKLLSDWFIDRKVDRPLRDAMPLVAKGSRVLWVVGGCIAEEAKLTGRERAICLEYTPENIPYNGGNCHGE